MDQKTMRDGIRMFLDGLGETFPGDDIERTPERVARAWTDELVSGYSVRAADELTWTAVPAGGGPVLVHGVSFASVCVHHLLPFFGQADIAYLPAERQAGLSKIARVVDAFARRLQTQERLTAQIADALNDGLAPRGVIVVLRAEHLCMSLRGVRKEQAGMVTMATRGLYDADLAARAELLELMRDPRTSG